jgi:hypothetical protein
VDLSAIIFVVLALAWAVYLIPKALKHHDEMASDRLVEGHSDKVRILSRHGKAARDNAETVEAPEAPAPVIAAPRPLVTRAAARKAAKRRRRVLGVLVLALAVVWALTWFAYLPIWAPAVPGARPEVDERVETRVETHPAPKGSQDLVDLLNEDTVGVPRQEIEAALADDGSLWDPLPLTLPTYVNKARARRTVRTIELTGINSSGHDQADTTLAREAAESQKSARDSTDTVGESRRVAGA